MAIASPEQFEDQMARLIWETRWKEHNSFDVWLQNHMCREGAAVFALEHTVFADEFPRWFGNIIGNCPELDVRQYMIENMYVEEVTDPTIDTGHYESMVDFSVALGFERSYVYVYKGRTYTKMALAYWDRASRVWPWLEAFRGGRRTGGGAWARRGETWQHRFPEPEGVGASWAAGRGALSLVGGREG